MEIEQDPITICFHQSSRSVRFFPTLKKCFATDWLLIQKKSNKERNFVDNNLHRGQESDCSALKKCSWLLLARKFAPVDLFRCFEVFNFSNFEKFKTLSEAVLLEAFIEHWNISPCNVKWLPILDPSGVETDGY